MNVDTDKLVTNVAAVNFSGRFKGQELRDLGQAFLHHVVAAKDVGLVLGQQVGNGHYGQGNCIDEYPVNYHPLPVPP